MKRAEFAAAVAAMLTDTQVVELERLHDELDASGACEAWGTGVGCCVDRITEAFDKAHEKADSPAPGHRDPDCVAQAGSGPYARPADKVDAASEG